MIRIMSALKFLVTWQTMTTLLTLLVVRVDQEGVVRGQPSLYSRTSQLSLSVQWPVSESESAGSSTQLRNSHHRLHYLNCTEERETRKKILINMCGQ